MTLGRHTELPNQNCFTYTISVALDIYELPFPGLVWNRFPWVGGYVLGPATYLLVAYGPLANYFMVTPFMKPLAPFTYVKEGVYVEQVRALLCMMFVFHFMRRLLEMCCLNTYTAKTDRKSDAEASYYFLWGLFGGWAGTRAMVAQFGVVNQNVFIVGYALYVFGAAMNCYCHVQLRWLKMEAQGNYVVPNVFPFQYFVMPHYTFEMVTWTGFAICAGFNFASLFMWGMSFCVLHVWTHKKRLTYASITYDRLDSQDSFAGYPPGKRWGLFPGL